MAGKLAVGPELAFAVARLLADELTTLTNCWPQNEPANQLEFDEACTRLEDSLLRAQAVVDILFEWAKLNGVTRPGRSAAETYASITE